MKFNQYPLSFRLVSYFAVISVAMLVLAVLVGIFYTHVPTPILVVLFFSSFVSCATGYSSAVEFEKKAEP